MIEGKPREKGKRAGDREGGEQDGGREQHQPGGDLGSGQVGQGTDRPAAERHDCGQGEHPDHQEAAHHTRLATGGGGGQEQADRDQRGRPRAGYPGGGKAGPPRRHRDPAKAEGGDGEHGRDPEEEG